MKKKILVCVIIILTFGLICCKNNDTPPPENAPDPLPASKNYRWTNADTLVDYAEDNGKRIRGHVLIWHAQTPAWFFRGSGTSNRATKAELYERMEKHIKTVFIKYRGRIDTWDVCNEVVDHASPHGPRSDSNYTRIMTDSGLTGMDRYEYVVKAFEWARKYADENGGQNVKLYLTDYGIERRFPDAVEGQKSKIDGFEDLVDYLIEKNAPIDGVGFQGHFRLYDHPVEQISAGIDRFSAKEKADGTKLTVQVCELDFSVFSNAKSEAGDNKTTIPNDKLAERLTDLAQTYLDFFNMFEEKFEEGKLTMVLIWGIADKHSWLNNDPVSGRTDYPLLFDRDYNPKKAFYKLAGCDDETDYDGEELHTKWSFPLGVAVPGASTTNTQNNNAFQADNPQYPLLRHFNVVVAENEMKPSNIMPSSASDF